MIIARLTARSDSNHLGLSPRRGFTIVELSAVVAIIAILVSLLCAALNHTKTKALRITCLENMRQLQVAWSVYTEDYGDSLPLNQTAPAPNHPRIFARQSSNNSWVTGNPLEDRGPDNIKKGSLFPYVKSAAAYKCPMDDSTVPAFPDVPRSRSYSMSAFLGGDPELDPKYKYTELLRPDNVFVFIEEHESSLWQSSFLVVPNRSRLSAASAAWVSTPADRHTQGCNISFADGHMEYWRWSSPKDIGAANAQPSQPSMSGREISDIRRLAGCVP